MGAGREVGAGTIVGGTGMKSDLPNSRPEPQDRSQSANATREEHTQKSR